MRARLTHADAAETVLGDPSLAQVWRHSRGARANARIPKRTWLANVRPSPLTHNGRARVRRRMRVMCRCSSFELVRNPSTQMPPKSILRSLSSIPRSCPQMRRAHNSHSLLQRRTCRSQHLTWCLQSMGSKDQRRDRKSKCRCQLPHSHMLTIHGRNEGRRRPYPPPRPLLTQVVTPKQAHRPTCARHRRWHLST